MMAAPCKRNLVIALPRDAAEACATLEYTRDVLARAGDMVTLLHVRLADMTVKTAVPFQAVEEPLSGLADDVLLGNDEQSVAVVLQAASSLGNKASSMTLLKLRSPLRITDALMSYITSLTDGQRDNMLLIFGSHTAASDPATWRYASRTTLDVAAVSPVPVVIVRGASRATNCGRRFVVLAVDGRAPTSTLLVKWACANVLSPTDTVLLCHMPTAADDEATKQELALCDKMLLSFTAQGGKAITGHPLGSDFDVRDALVDLGQSGVAGISDGPPHLLVLAGRGPSALKRAAPLGSVCQYMLCNADCPMAVVPPLALAQ